MVELATIGCRRRHGCSADKAEAPVDGDMGFLPEDRQRDLWQRLTITTIADFATIFVQDDWETHV